MADYSKETHIEPYEMQSLQEALEGIKKFQERFNAFRDIVSKKYQLGDKDEFNIFTGEITRIVAPVTEEAPVSPKRAKNPKPASI